MISRSLVILLGLFLVSPVSALEFRGIGTKSTSMGGVGVASSSSAYASHFNPALLARYKKVVVNTPVPAVFNDAEIDSNATVPMELQTPDSNLVHTESNVEIAISFGLSYQDKDFADHLDALIGYDLQDTLDAIADNAPTEDGEGKKDNTQETRDNLIDLQDRLLRIDNYENIVVNTNSEMLFSINSFAFGVSTQSSILTSVVVDTNHLEMISEIEGDNFETDPGDLYYARYDPKTDKYVLYITDDKYEDESLMYAMENGLTYANVTVFSLTEVPLSYGHDFYFSNIGELDVGATLKYLRGSSYYTMIDMNTESEDYDNWQSDFVNSSSYGVDLGLAFSPTALKDLTIGLVAKYLNSPTFDTAYGEIKIEPMVRAGIAYQAFDMLEIAIDYDITSNKTLLDESVEKQYLGAGVNFYPFSWFSLRGGVMQDLAENTSGSIYTAGLGIGHEKFMLELSAQMSKDTFSIEDKDYPEYAKAQLAIISKW